jgi:hypothetical protein
MGNWFSEYYQNETNTQTVTNQTVTNEDVTNQTVTNEDVTNNPTVTKADETNKTNEDETKEDDINVTINDNKTTNIDPITADELVAKIKNLPELKPFQSSIELVKGKIPERTPTEIINVIDEIGGKSLESLLPREISSKLNTQIDNSKPLLEVIVPIYNIANNPENFNENLTKIIIPTELSTKSIEILEFINNEPNRSLIMYSIIEIIYKHPKLTDESRTNILAIMKIITANITENPTRYNDKIVDDFLDKIVDEFLDKNIKSPGFNPVISAALTIAKQIMIPILKTGINTKFQSEIDNIIIILNKILPNVKEVVTSNIETMNKLPKHEEIETFKQILHQLYKEMENATKSDDSVSSTTGGKKKKSKRKKCKKSKGKPSRSKKISK